MTYKNKLVYFFQNLLVSLIAPAISLYYGLKNGNKSQQKIVLFIFFLFYGATLHMDVENDGHRHLEAVRNFYPEMSFRLFINSSLKILVFQESGVGSDDIYKHVVSYLSGNIIGYPPIFFVIVAGVYGFFFINSIYEIFDRPLFNRYLPLMAVGFLFIMHKNVEGVNTVRTWTAMWILLFGVIKFLKYKNNKYLIFIALTPLVHFSYIVFIVPVLAGLFIKRKPNLALAAFLLSMVFSGFNPNKGLSNRFGGQEIIKERIENYSIDKQSTANERWANINKKKEQRLYKSMQSFGLQSYAFVFIIFIMYFFVIRIYNPSNLFVYFFTLGTTIHAFSNFTWFITEVAGRSRVIGEMFILISLFLILRDTAVYFRKKEFKWGLNIYLILMIPFAIWNTSRWFDHPSLFSFIMPGLVIINPEMNFSLKQALRFLIPF
ncbi:MAG: EpsG family protein [Phaeodactylibacter sp.]|uniref:EpsG family protein n=1 Tax=Phaeodactylibacter sp. TaxID=1940289 RepID=UPI0032EBF0CC